MLPDLTHQLGLDRPYGAHSGAPYKQSYVVPGTVDPEIPSHILSADQPDTRMGEKRLEDTAGFLHLMDMLFEVVHKPGFEYAGPYVLGGKSQAALGQIANVTGTGSIYTIENEFDTDAEYCCLAAVFGAAGQAILSKDPMNQGPALTAFIDSSATVRGLPFFSAGVATLTYGSEYWFPIPASDSLFWAVNMATPNTDSALACIAFRRRINRHGRYFLTQE